MSKQVTFEEFLLLFNISVEKHRNTDEPIPEMSEANVDKIKNCLQIPFMTFDKVDLYKSIYDKAGILLYVFIKNHPLTNGNKRLALIVTAYFLKKNKKELPIYGDDIYDLAKHIASSDSSDKDKILQYIKEKIQPMASKNKELDQLKKIIADPRTGEEEKKRFQSIVDKIEGVKPEPAVAVQVKEEEPIIAPKKRSHHKKKPIEPIVSTVVNEPKIEEKNKRAIPDCDTLIEGFKANKKARLERQAKKEKDHRSAGTKLIEEADKKVTAIINNIIKLSKKKQLSSKARKDILTILKQGINHVNKV